MNAMIVHCVIRAVYITSCIKELFIFSSYLFTLNFLVKLKAIQLIARREPIIPTACTINFTRYTGRFLCSFAAYG
jgi:hypothetical protein